MIEIFKIIITDVPFLLWLMLGVILGSALIFGVAYEQELIAFEDRILNGIRTKLRKNVKFMAWLNNEPVPQKKAAMPIRTMNDWRQTK